ncbi:GIY-YIG nuclease family protein [Vibrio sp. 99-8-1]|uniref:GIY-YIG nuclease family protein n=1 Tax=Vibrio sp. 99-8-1 TaxID=2607602 RepID=UPI0014939DFA|nr:GIY-YIG nuclease family protein [Vibrio sp. 99-8-1]NOI65193.1 GIY-YIG nuclease family protein [Vibrio sp. 99-8-1]
MDLFNFLTTLCNDIVPKRTKVHLAVWNGQDNPLEVYLAGDFEEWQSWQSKKNFNLDFIVSLIQLPEPDTWLFAGAYHSIECEWNEDHYDYKTQEVEELKTYAGRLKVSFARSGRQSYLVAENWPNAFEVYEMLPEKLAVESFKGYQRTSLSRKKLDIIVKQQVNDWKTALSGVSGIYLITDLYTGKHYVGSATGDGGIWQRWSDYARSGHGGNSRFRQLIKDNGIGYVSNFQYSILEIADTHTTKEDILLRESYWKDILATRRFGLNNN